MRDKFVKKIKKVLTNKILRAKISNKFEYHKK